MASTDTAFLYLSLFHTINPVPSLLANISAPPKGLLLFAQTDQTADMEKLNHEQVFPTCVQLNMVHFGFSSDKVPMSLTAHLFF